MAYSIIFAESVKEQLKKFTVRQRTTIIDAIEKQLSDTPLVETRNRKPLRPNKVAAWELRVGNFRVFYEVIPDEPEIVNILAVGQKKGNKLYIAGKEVTL